VDGGGGALAELAGELDRAVGFDDDGASDGEAEAGSAGVACARWVAAIEAVEYMRKGFGGDAVAVVWASMASRSEIVEAAGLC